MKTLTIVLAATLLSLPACKEKQGQAQVTVGDPAMPSAEAPDWTYTARARVEKLPDAYGDLMLHHEHIPDFVSIQTGELNVNKDGVTGMRAMIMPFEPADGLDISGLKVGDLIEFELAVWGAESERGMGFEMTGFRMLAEDTELSFADKPSVEVPDDGP